MSQSTSQERFVALLDEHRKILFKVANSYCRSAADLDDLVQEMVLQLWRSFPRYDDSQRFTTWMYRVTLNVAISFRRGQQRRSKTASNSGESLLHIQAAPAQEMKEDLRLLQEFIAQLDELDRALVILYLDGNSYEDIATVLGISQSNVGVKLNRIKQQLRGDFAAHQKQEQ